MAPQAAMVTRTIEDHVRAFLAAEELLLGQRLQEIELNMLRLPRGEDEQCAVLASQYAVAEQLQRTIVHQREELEKAMVSMSTTELTAAFEKLADELDQLRTKIITEMTTEKTADGRPSERLLYLLDEVTQERASVAISLDRLKGRR